VSEPWRLELVRVGAVAPAVLRVLREDLARYLAHPVWVSPAHLDPGPAFDRHRQQYLAATLMIALLDPPPPPGLHRMGVTDVDLFLPVFTHVFGTAQIDGPVGIASVHRLRPEAAGDPPNQELLRRRIFKEVLHELGHTFGLVHCRIPWCAMSPSRVAEQVDLKDAAYCESCAQRLGIPGDGVRGHLEEEGRTP